MVEYLYSKKSPSVMFHVYHVASSVVLLAATLLH